MRDQSFEVGSPCKVAKRERLGGMWDKSRIVGGQPYQRMCGDYSKTSHAEHDDAHEKLMSGCEPHIGAVPRGLGSLG